MYHDKLITIARVITETASEIDGELCHAVDALAELRAHIAELKAVETALSRELTAGVELTETTEQGATGRLDGVAYHLTVTDAMRWSLDTKAVKAEMGADWYDARCKVSNVRTVRTFPNE